MEEWKDILGYEGLYQVSSEGRVRSLDRMVEQTGLKNVYQRIYKGRIKQPTIFKTGYAMVKLYNKNFMTQSVHRLVALAFVDPVEGKDTVDHINQNKLDNRACNLRWANASEQAINRPIRLSISKEQYIYISSKFTYRLRIRRQGFYYNETFKTLPEAIEARDALLTEV
jgi:hypothetical protein